MQTSEMYVLVEGARFYGVIWVMGQPTTVDTAHCKDASIYSYDEAVANHAILQRFKINAAIVPYAKAKSDQLRKQRALGQSIQRMANKPLQPAANGRKSPVWMR